MEGGGSIHTGRNNRPVLPEPLSLPLPSLMSRLLWANAPVSIPVSLSSLQVSLLLAYLLAYKWQKKKNSYQLLVYTTNRPTFTLKGPVVNNQTLQILLLLLQLLNSTPHL